MTTEEAIKILQKNKPTSDTRQCGVELCEAVDMALKALEKQIPKKPRAFYLGGDPFSYRCSACDMTIKAGDTFCKWCGQAQEWKEPKK